MTSGEDVQLEGIDDVLELVQSSIGELVESFVSQLPLFAVAAVVFLIGLALVRVGVRAVERALPAERLDDTVRRLTLVFTRLALLLGVTMVSLSVAGIDVGAALAAIGLLGLALAFAFQNILENFIAGILILIRKPFRVGDQIIAGDHEGTVTDVNMRVTKLRRYDGVNALLPNADVFRSPVVNLTEGGTRRSSVAFGVDYRDDHDEVAAVVLPVVAELEGVLATPPPEVLCTGLGDSSVDFVVRYWSLPTAGEIAMTQDRVARAVKTAVEAAGMTIPWPIRTLEPGAPLRLRTLDGPRGDESLDVTR